MKLVTLDIISAIINSLKYANEMKFIRLKKLVLLVNRLTLHVNDELVFTATTAALLKDIGNISANNGEVNQYKSAEIIRTMPEIIPLQYNIADIILQIGERIDGSGKYGLTELLFEAQIIGIVDEYLNDYNIDTLQNKERYDQSIVRGLIDLLNIDNTLKITNSEMNYIDEQFEDIVRQSNVYSLEVKGVTEEQFLSAIASIIDAQHEYTAGHTKRVANYSYIIAEHMNYSEEKLRNLRYSAYLHDIGKLAVNLKLLDKPGKLNLEEFEKIKRHAEYSYKIMQDSPKLKNIIFGALHHERIDGNGYPFGLKGDEIPEEAKIIAVADVLDALTSNRPYRKPITFQKALTIMEESMVGSSLDPKIFDIAKEIF